MAKPTTDHSTVPWPDARGPVLPPSSVRRPSAVDLPSTAPAPRPRRMCNAAPWRALPAVLQPARHVRSSTVRQRATQRAEDRVGDPTTWVRTIFPNLEKTKKTPRIRTQLAERARLTPHKSHLRIWQVALYFFSRGSPPPDLPYSRPHASPFHTPSHGGSRSLWKRFIPATELPGRMTNLTSG